MNKFWKDEVPDEPYGVPAKEAAGHHRWGGQPHEVLVREAVHPVGLFQGQNYINK